MNVRVRYAPSPTGLQHIGAVRTALFNYFFARAHGGKFILRIEDTDRGRSTPEALTDLYSTLRWLGIDYDEGPLKGGEFDPYVQSERIAIYREKAAALVSQGLAYPCFCLPGRLDALRLEQQTTKSLIGYDRRCRPIPHESAMGRIESGESHVIRLKIPLEGRTLFHDILLGETGRRNKDINPDPIILKSDGLPTYHLANVVDDHMMGITHVMRAQEWLPSGPLHMIIYRAFGWNPPSYCHLPMVMGKDGQKLSKRHGSTSLREFRQAGYLPEALLNYISLLGWGYDDSREFFSMDELCALFTLEKIKKSPAVFDYRKLAWFNGQYIRMKEPEILKATLLSILIQDGVISSVPTEGEKKIFDGVFPVIRERLKLLNDVSALLRFLFEDPGMGNPADAIPPHLSGSETLVLLKTGLELIEGASPAPDGTNHAASTRWEEERESDFRHCAEKNGWKFGVMLQPLRLALTASKVSPPLFPAIRLLGLEESARRIRRLIEALTLER